MSEADPDLEAARTGEGRGRSDRGLAARIRTAGPRDARGLNGLMAGIYREGSWFVGDGAPGAEALARRIRAADPDVDLWLVAEDETGLVGWSELHRMAPSRMRHVASLTLAVDASARGRGLGRALLQATYPWARRVGVLRLRLDVRANNAAALRLYESEGFVHEGREIAQVRTDEGFEDNLLMGKWLPPDERRRT